MPNFFRQRLFLFVVLAALSTTLLSTSFVLARAGNGLHWEKIHVYNAAPTVVFAKLGLTHSTRNGHTRDGKQGVPDPDFPPGLTDVVPDDAEKILLVRGTASGVDLFRARVTAADTVSPPLHLHAALQGGTDSNGAALGTADSDGVREGSPVQISVGNGDSARVYQITARSNPDGSLWIACRVSLPLPDQSQSAPTGPVFIPERIWTDPQARKVRPGETAVFQDLASVRQAAARKLGASGTDAGTDYALSITLTPAVTH